MEGFPWERRRLKMNSILATLGNKAIFDYHRPAAWPGFIGARDTRGE